ncbi:hypothetical protein [Kutzneria albida]|uniref:Secreted protein n=1 Tax=Kutzneria albida DSM 43870 TaxID=1449976 RepID=W5WLT4_9PSEU|nr:hypothetical protein [Kutzneria albida]AHI01527.1 hypothetical protein KALB_8169 [Kutzneria albida DSM 43870]
MIRKLVPVLAALLLAASPVPASAVTSAEDYGAYSMMFSQHAGQFTPDGVNLYQWAWKPTSPTESRIYWGESKSWPPSYGERFLRDGDWVLLDGYDAPDNGFNPQRVTSESVGDANCANLSPIPSNGGRQHYVRWTIPSTAYCLQATGTITVPANGAVVHFQHNQVWYPPAPCEAPGHPGQTCIRQHEQWFDDKDQPFGLVLERDQYIARGHGMAFLIDKTRPDQWHAHITSDWSWPA